MKSAVIVFPASNCDRDAAVALKQATGRAPVMVWHGETELPDVDLIFLPGGFSYGDYLRSGAMAARAPIMDAIRRAADKGVSIIGVCNGFQILSECGLLPGALLRNAGLDFVCRDVALRHAGAGTRFTEKLGGKPVVTFPVAHHDGRYFADDETLRELDGEGRIAFRYVDNPNGSALNIAGIVNKSGNILGMMPHPERAISPLLGGVDGAAFFDGLAGLAA